MRLKLLCIIIIVFNLTFSQNKGNLFIIGGGSIPDYMIKEYTNLAGGKDSKFLIIPFASSEQEFAINSFTKKLNSAGCTNIVSVIGTKEQIDADSNLAKLTNVKGVFFTGGDQSKLTGVLLGTKFLEKIKEIYNKGGTIGGTSAGAAVISEVMLTGNEKLNTDTVNSYTFIKKDNIETAKGFGFLTNAIIDQHFIKRKRLNRLISIVIENPKLLGIGIDESTAIIVKPNDTFEVIGESNVIVFDATKSKNISVNKNGNLSVNDIKMHLLKEGDQFNLKNLKIISPKKVK